MALVVFTGGARSGKSAAAVRLVESRPTDAGVTVVAFGQAGIDAEFAERIATHRAQRPRGWTTVEAHDSLGWVRDVPETDIVVVDCLGTLLGLMMDEVNADAEGSVLWDEEEMPRGFEESVERRLHAALKWITEREGDTIVVTNEVGDGVVPAYWAGRLFRDALGRANRVLVDRADAAYLCVAGRLIDLHGLPASVRWPED